MIEVTERELLERIDWQERLAKRDNIMNPIIVFLTTPLCGTCAAARKMINVAEHVLTESELLEADVNFLPLTVERYQIRSVPAILAVNPKATAPEQYEVLYRMGSVQDILDFVRSVKG
ncbi:hypothetical protein JCM10914A_41460 [Paenibacillus sp. JCM 10914]|uniref:thioredoxin n=1 Tax=Paenibacillus sp. JCM 10914 TaxID=1236974 RepID=UPI0003CC9C7D|nr:thioredoxin [Paenibacillus sp. JCM 10914]GAE05360.1 thioredoxin [Paenibacillus sp. JCM 10914]